MIMGRPAPGFGGGFGGIRGPVRSPGFPGMPVNPVGPAPVGPSPFRPPAPIANPILGTFHKGGKVKKSGVYRLLAGEKVLSLADLKKAKK